ncbi:MAG: hypothetical protein FJZ09_01730 [Candidatus Omnitrophica bacterium]|nr:hypothetical protein [Candidatus Omnitrophota bacterium]
MTEKMMTIIMALVLSAVVLVAAVNFLKSRRLPETEEVEYQQPKKEQTLPAEKDSDRDGVPDSLDSEPFDRRKF